MLLTTDEIVATVAVHLDVARLIYALVQLSAWWCYVFLLLAWKMLTNSIWKPWLAVCTSFIGLMLVLELQETENSPEP
jgi:hypothetical protein